MKQSARVFWKIFFVGIAAFALLLLLINVGLFGKFLHSVNLKILPSYRPQRYMLRWNLMGKYSGNRGNRSNVDYNDISKHVINALVATEDERFYEHSGIDGKSVSCGLSIF